MQYLISVRSNIAEEGHHIDSLIELTGDEYKRLQLLRLQRDKNEMTKGAEYKRLAGLGTSINMFRVRARINNCLELLVNTEEPMTKEELAAWVENTSYTDLKKYKFGGPKLVNRSKQGIPEDLL